MLESLFLQLGFIIVIAVILSGVMRLLGQPFLIGYILTGILVGPYFLNIAGPQEAIATFSKFGIAFLLFVVGLSLDPAKIKNVGFTSLVTGVGQVLFTSGLGFLIARFLGFGYLTAGYIAVALTFSSTIIVVKLLSDKKEMDTLHGRIAVGFLVVQDLIVALLLMVAPLLAKNGAEFEVEKLLMAFGLFALIVPFGFFVLPPLCRRLAKSQELLFLFSIAWVLLLAMLFEFFHISIELGTLLAGITLASFPFAYEMKARMKPLRDFFLLFFFIWIGGQMAFANLAQFWPAILVFSLFVLIGNPIIVMVLMGLMRYSKRTGFLSGLTVAQISEFSLIFVAMGVHLGHLGQDILSLITAVGLVTIFGSTYLVVHSHRLYAWFSPILKPFERKVRKIDALQVKGKKPYNVILFGCDRIGSNLLEVLERVGGSLLIIDYNPEIVRRLRRAGYNAQYGDAKDPELLDALNLEKVKMVVSTVPDFEANALVIREVTKQSKQAVVIAVSYHTEDTLRLYKQGASYVFMPYFLGAAHASRIIDEFRFDKQAFQEKKTEHLAQLRQKEKQDFDHYFEGNLV